MTITLESYNELMAARAAEARIMGGMKRISDKLISLHIEHELRGHVIYIDRAMAPNGEVGQMRVAPYGGSGIIFGVSYSSATKGHLYSRFDMLFDELFSELF